VPPLASSLATWPASSRLPHGCGIQPQKEATLDSSFIDNATVDQLVDALHDLENLGDLLTRQAERDRNRQHQQEIMDELEARGITLTMIA